MSDRPSAPSETRTRPAPRRSVVALRLAVVASLLWISIGAFPPVNIEGDSALFSAGCERLVANSLRLPPDYFYMWDMQPLTGFLVAGLGALLPMLSCELLYVLLSQAAALLFLFTASRFLARISSLRQEYCYFLLLLFPESISIGYYPNTSIFAALLFLTGLTCMLRRPLGAGSVIALALAPLLRIDILLLYPLVLPLLWHRYSLGTSLKYTAIHAVVLVPALLAGFRLLQADPLLTWSQYSTLAGLRASSFSLESFLRIQVSFYPLAGIGLIAAGVVLLVRRRAPLLLVLSLFPAAVLYLLHRDFTGAGAKHLLYVLPFLCIPCAAALGRLAAPKTRRLRAVRTILILLAASQAVLGLRFYPASKPWVSDAASQIHPRPTLATLLSLPAGSAGRIELALGAGMVIPTADELMLVSGHLYTPFYWHSVKTRVCRERDVVREILQEGGEGDSLFVMTTVGSDWALSQQLHGLGFRIESLDQTGTDPEIDTRYWFRRGDRRILVTCITTGRSAASFDSAYARIPQRPLYVIVEYDWQRYFVSGGLTEAVPLSANVSVVR